MKSKMNVTKKFALLFMALILASCASIYGQTTEFTYQGKLFDSGGSAAAYDMVFRLCATESASCATPLATFSQSNVVPTSGGVFSVKVDFGFGPFNGGDRYIEVAMKRTTDTTYTTLTPRQKVTSAPYASQSLNSTFFNNREIEDFILEGDSRLQPNYSVLNSTLLQSGVNFNIGGTGTANIFSANTQFNLNGSRILGAPGSSNIFAGNGAGSSYAAGGNNSFFGSNAGSGLLIGSNNTAIGFSATSNGSGLSNTTAVGALASVTQSNSLVLGSINGTNGATADTRVGIGTTAPANKMHIVDASNTGLRVQTNTAGGSVGSFGGNGVFQVDAVNVVGGRLNVLENGNVGIGNPTPTAKLEVTGNGTGSTALEVNNGAIKVTGAGFNTQTAVFKIEKNATNTCGQGRRTVIDNPYSNNDPNAVIFVTPVTVEPLGTEITFNVYYATTVGTGCESHLNKWVIVSDQFVDTITIRFNVMVIKS